MENNLFKYSNKNIEEIVKDFKTDLNKGLPVKRAEQLLREHGKNEISSKAVKWWHILLRQFKSPFIYLLFAAAILALFLGEKLDAVLILLFLAINASLGFYQEYRSEKTLQMLKKYITSYAKVIRGGKESAIIAEEVVQGDVIVLETGDKIPADARFFETQNFIVDESILTGESVPVEKISDKIEKEIHEYHKAINIGFAGTTVINGKAKGIVAATGKISTIGKIASLENEISRVSNFEKNIAHLSKFIIWLVLATLVFVFFANIFIKGADTNFIALILFSVALAVSVIPEALPVVTTFSLSRGALRLVKQKVIVKRLSAIEDLGGMEILCTDKTGTLTENILTVAEIYAPWHDADEILLYANLAASSVQKHKLEPFDIALWEKLPVKQKDLSAQFIRVRDIPFDPHKRRNIVLVTKDGKEDLITRGAPEIIMELCQHIQEKAAINKWISQQGIEGKRVIAVAKKPQSGSNKIENEKDFSLLGIISFIDPIKESTFEAVKQSKNLGVKIVILTGDNKEVAGAVAHQIGLIASPRDVITGEEFERLSLIKQFEVLEDNKVYARVSPEQKYKIIKLLQEKHEVGFLGEGINDVPALKAAGVSLVVQSAADIAREAADIVLLKKNLKVILDGIKEGREVFTNTTNYIKITLASNFGNFYALAVSSLLVDFLPMLPLQILVLNLLSDFPMIAISTDRVSSEEIGAPKKYDVRDMIFLATMLGIVSTVFDFIFFGLYYKSSPEVLQTNWFIGSVLTELALIFSLRSKTLFVKSERPSKPLFYLTVLAGLVALVLPFTEFGQRVLRFAPPSFNAILLIFLIVLVYFMCSEIVKFVYYHKRLNSKEGKKV